jgi:hypothetical protein
MAAISAYTSRLGNSYVIAEKHDLIFWLNTLIAVVYVYSIFYTSLRWCFINYNYEVYGLFVVSKFVKPRMPSAKHLRLPWKPGEVRGHPQSLHSGFLA